MNIKQVWRDGVVYGIRVIGVRNKNYWLYQTPDGKRHRSQKAALDHLEERSMRRRLRKLERAWRCKVVAA